VVFVRIRAGFFEDLDGWFSKDLAVFSGIRIGGFL